MLVSVAIPTYNSADYLKEAIQSALDQTRPPDEIIVVDDGSTDHTRDICSSFGQKLKYIYQSNDRTFGAGARAVAMRAARGKWIALLDHDDLWLPAKIERQLEVAKSYPEARAIFTKGRLIDGAGQVIQTPEGLSGSAYQIPAREAFHLLLTDTPFLVSSTFMLRSFIDDHGITDPFNLSCSDWDLWLNIARQYPIVMVDEVLTEYRRFPEQQTTANLNRLMFMEERTLKDQLKHLHPNCADCRRSYRKGQAFIAHGYQVLARDFLKLYHQKARSGQFKDSLPLLWRALRNSPGEVLSPSQAMAVIKTVMMAPLKAMTGGTGQTQP